jgi:hypothetical protein
LSELEVSDLQLFKRSLKKAKRFWAKLLKASFEINCFAPNGFALVSWLLTILPE